MRVSVGVCSWGWRSRVCCWYRLKAVVLYSREQAMRYVVVVVVMVAVVVVIVVVVVVLVTAVAVVPYDPKTLMKIPSP